MLLLVVAAGCAAKIERPAAPVLLAYGGVTGERRFYDLKQTLRGRITLQGMPQLMVIKLQARVEEHIESVSADGKRRVRMTYDFSPPEINGIAVESEKFPRRVETLLLRAPSGEIDQLESDQPPSSLWGWAAWPPGGEFPLLPRRQVNQGETWERLQMVPLAGGGELQVATSGSFLGMERSGSKDARVARLSINGRINLVKPIGIEELGLETFRLKYSGTVTFAIDGGVVIESRREGLVQVKGWSNHARMEGRVRFTSVLKQVLHP